MGTRLLRNAVGGALLLVACLALAADPLQPPVLLSPGGGGPATGGNLASQCSDGIDNDGDGLVDWVGKAGRGDPGCPTPDYAGGECTDPECAPDPQAPGVGLASLPDSVTAWPGSYSAEGAGGCPSGSPGSLKAGATYQYCAFSGDLYVDVNNVTCYGCRIRSTGTWAIRVEGGDNFRCIYCRIEPSNDQTPPISYNDGYQYGVDFRSNAQDGVIQRSHFVGYGNAIVLDGAGCSTTHPCTFRGNVFDMPRNDGGDKDHTDGIGCLSAGSCVADNVTITGNYFLGYESSEGASSNTNGIAMQEGDSNTNGYKNLLVTRNYITGWGYAVVLEEGSANNTNNLVVNNWFGTEYKPVFGPTRQWADSMGVWAANRWNVTSNGTWSYPTLSDGGKFWYPGDGSTSAKHATDYLGNSKVPYPEPACNDGIDNDGDGNIDYPWDSGCTSAIDTAE